MVAARAVLTTSSARDDKLGAATYGIALALSPCLGLSFACFRAFVIGHAMSDVTLLLHRMAHHDPQAANKLLGVVYDELRKIAVAKMAREAAGHTLQPTALVHEAWLNLGADRQPEWQNRAHFFSAAAEAMRRILIGHARRKHALRRGGDLERVSMDDPAFEFAAPGGEDALLEVHEALDRLAEEDPRKAELVKLRFFAGLSVEQAADTLGVSVPTAKRDWAYARGWLGREIQRRHN